MSASTAVAVRKSSRFTPPRFRFLLWVILLLFPLHAVPAAEPTMTLLRRESQPISEGQTIIRSQYLYQPPAIAGVARPATTVTKEIVVVGCGVNYDANRGVGQPRWVASNGSLAVAGRAGVAYESTAGPLEFSLPVASDQWLVVRKNGRVVSSRFVGAAAATAIKGDDRTARYLNVFPDTDLVWQVGNGYLKESLILRSRTAPTEFSFLLESPDFAFLASDASQSTFSLTEIRATAQATKVAGPMLLAPATAKQNHQILMPAPVVVDARGKRSSLRCFVSRTPTGALLYTMRIPAGFLTARALTYPLTVDPSYINVTTATVTLFEAGQTYYIANPIYYTTEQVRIEANAFLKFHPWGGGGNAGSLNCSGSSSIHVEGTPYNYAYFTSGYDDSVGEDVDGPTTSGLPLLEGNPNAGDYSAAFAIASGGSIQYAKFAYAGTAVVIDGPGPGPSVYIEHSIFRNNSDDVSIYCTDNQPVCGIWNCLFVGGGTGARAESNPEYGGYIYLSVSSCTFDGVGTAVAVNDDMYESTYVIKYNIFANTGCGINYNQQNPEEHPSFSIDYNAVYNTSSYVSPEDLPGVGQHCADEYDTSPFVANANGSYYLREGCLSRDYGDCPGMSGKTSTALSGVRTIQADIHGSQTWTLYSGRTDNGLLNLGYHYDPVDWIVGGNVFVYGSVRVLEGVTVAFCDGGSLLVQSGGSVDVGGTGSAPIRFSSTLACGDETSGSLLWGGLFVLSGATGAFEHCTFENAYNALLLVGSAGPIENCRFGGCWWGVLGAGSGEQRRTIRNCLFLDICGSAILGTTSTLLSVLNCTTSRTGVGVELYPQTSATVLNCIFVGSPLAISKATSAPLSEKYNCFWHNARDTNFTSASTDRHQDPKFAATTTADLYQRFYLDQDNSPCVDGGNPDDLPFMSTTPSGWPDFGHVDIGYHYPGAGIEPSGSYPYLPNYVTSTTLFYPRSLQLNDGTILCSVHTGTSARLFEDKYYGLYWTEGYGLRITATDIPQNDTGYPRDTTESLVNSRHLIQLRNQSAGSSLSNGTVLMALHYVEDSDTTEGEQRFIHSIEMFGMSPDDTTPTWTWHSTVRREQRDDDPTTHLVWAVMEPFLLERHDGGIVCFFTRQPASNGWTAVWTPGHIAAKIWNETAQQWEGENNSTGETALPVTVASLYDPGQDIDWLNNQPQWHFGMPYAVELPDGKIYAVFEAANLPISAGGTHGGIRSSTSADGGYTWPTGYPYGNLAQAVYDTPADRNSGCPNIVRLTDGRLVCAFTTNEDWTNPVTGGDWGAKADVKAITSTDWGETWSPSFVVASQRNLTQPRHCSWSGLIRLRDESLLCTFNDGPAGLVDGKSVIEEAKSVIVNYRLGADTPLIEEHFDQLNLDGMPFVWGLLGDWFTTTTQGHGNVLRGTGGPGRGAKAFRGDTSWTDYAATASIKLETDGAWAGLCVRLDSWIYNIYGHTYVEYACYRCYIDHGKGKWGLEFLRPTDSGWVWDDITTQSLSSFDRGVWHTLAVQARGNTFDCYLDSNHITVTDPDDWFPSGMIGLRVTNGTASFDDVRVVDLRGQ